MTSRRSVIVLPGYMRSFKKRRDGVRKRKINPAVAMSAYEPLATFWRLIRILPPRGMPVEFDLLAASCAWPIDDARVRQIRNIVAGNIDWERFGRLARRHRVEAMA